MTAPGHLLADHREEPSGLPALLRDSGFTVDAADLPVGDYVVSDLIALERKSGWDLGASVKDGRLFDQAERLQDAYPRAVLIVEGEPLGLPEPAWRGAVCKLVEDGVTVLRTEGVADSAQWIARLAKRAARTKTVPRGLGRRRAAPTTQAQAAAMLAAVPGISWAGAHRLLAHFGTVGAVALASERELREVAGIGRGRARALREVVEHPFDPALVRPGLLPEADPAAPDDPEPPDGDGPDAP